MLPALNLLAVLDQSRNSPLEHSDRGNMNRVFPGTADGGPTSKIAHFVNQVLLPQCDLMIDLHDGGKVSEFLPSALLSLGDADPQTAARNFELTEAFCAPWTWVVPPTDAPPTQSGVGLTAAAIAQGCAAVSTEIGGLGTVTLEVQSDPLWRTHSSRRLDRWGAAAGRCNGSG